MSFWRKVQLRVKAWGRRATRLVLVPVAEPRAEYVSPVVPPAPVPGSAVKAGPPRKRRKRRKALVAVKPACPPLPEPTPAAAVVLGSPAATVVPGPPVGAATPSTSARRCAEVPAIPAQRSAGLPTGGVAPCNSVKRGHVVLLRQRVPRLTGRPVRISPRAPRISR